MVEPYTPPRAAGALFSYIFLSPTACAWRYLEISLPFKKLLLYYLPKQIHDLGLKYGIYEDYGTKTCGGYPGVLEHLELDANTLAEWGADYIKLDGCYSDPSQHAEG